MKTAQTHDEASQTLVLRCCSAGQRGFATAMDGNLEDFESLFFIFSVSTTDPASFLKK